MGCAQSVSARAPHDVDVYAKCDASATKPVVTTTASDEFDCLFQDPRLSAFSKVLPSLEEQSKNMLKAKAETVILFDWDDVLCPSSWASFHGILSGDAQTKPKTHHGLRTLSSRVANMLWQAQAFGKVFLVTQMSRPWIDTSCNLLMPELASALEWIPVIYANELSADMADDTKLPWDADVAAFRTQMQSSLSSSCTEAKARAVQVAFASLPSRSEGMSLKNIVYIGNGSLEHEEMRQVWHQLPQSAVDLETTRTKMVKLMDIPNLKGIRLQVSLVSRLLSRIVYIDDDVDVSLKDVVSTTALSMNRDASCRYTSSGSSASTRCS